MQIFGLDFTSAPSRRKPIVCAQAWRDRAELRIEHLLSLHNWPMFEIWLATPGTWLAGVDFPLGQPRRLSEALDWGGTWTEQIASVAALSKPEFITSIDAYRACREPGDKEHLRSSDRLARALSPMKVHGVPVGRMFYEGATRLARSPLSLLPCRPTNDPRTIIEIYPALVARCAIRKPYKRAHTADEQARRLAILDWLGSADCCDRYGCTVVMPEAVRAQALEDQLGDYLDAILAALQTAWASQQPGYGVPPDCDPAEGWIVDPLTLERWQASLAAPDFILE